MQDKKGKRQRREEEGGEFLFRTTYLILCDASFHRGHNRGVDHDDGTEQAEGDDT